MKLLFKPQEDKYLGKGDLPFGTFDDPSCWLPVTRYLEMGAEKFPNKTFFKVADMDGLLNEAYTYEQANAWSNSLALDNLRILVYNRQGLSTKPYPFL